MDDYQSRKSDERFKKWDDAMSSSDDHYKMNIVLSIGVFICMIMLASSIYTKMGDPIPQKYDYGLNISYDSQSSVYYIDYTNPNKTTSQLNVNIKIPYSTSDVSAYTTIYETSTSSFPSNISYKPYNKDMEHIVMVTLVKPNGNYTCFFSNIPNDDEKMYNGITQYIDRTKKYFNLNNISS